MTEKANFIREPRENELILSLANTITGKTLVFIVTHKVMNPNRPEETLLSTSQGWPRSWPRTNLTSGKGADWTSQASELLCQRSNRSYLVDFPFLCFFLFCPETHFHMWK